MGFFSMGCILVGVFLVPGCVKRFGKKQVYLGDYCCDSRSVIMDL